MCDASTSACSFPACDATDGTKICSCGTTSSTSSSSVCTSNTGYVCDATTGTCSFPACAGTETTGKCECGTSTCVSETGFRCNAATSTCSFPLCTNIYGILPINDVDGGPECFCTSGRDDDEGAICITRGGNYNYNPYCRIKAVGNSECSTSGTKMNPIVVCNACKTESLNPEFECRPPSSGSDKFYEACLCGESTVCAGRLGNGCDTAASTCKVEECYSVDSSFDNRVSCQVSFYFVFFFFPHMQRMTNLQISLFFYFFFSAELQHVMKLLAPFARKQKISVQKTSNFWIAKNGKMESNL